MAHWGTWDWIKCISLIVVAISAMTIPIEVVRNYFGQKKLKEILKKNKANPPT